MTLTQPCKARQDIRIVAPTFWKHEENSYRDIRSRIANVLVRPLSLSCQSDIRAAELRTVIRLVSAIMLTTLSNHLQLDWNVAGLTLVKLRRRTYKSSIYATVVAHCPKSQERFDISTGQVNSRLHFVPKMDEEEKHRQGNTDISDHGCSECGIYGPLA